MLLLLIGAGCGGGRQGTSSQPSLTYQSSHFVFHYTTIDSSSIETIAGRLEAEYSRILTDLVSGPMPVVNVELFADHSAMEKAGLPLAIPSWAGGFTPSESRIVLMSPNLPEWGPFDTGVGNLIHEFAHCVSSHLNPSIGNNPRWLWESVAVWEARQFVDPRTVSYLANHQPPAFSQFNDLNDRRIYEIGYLVGEFAASRWGQSALHDLVLSNGDTARRLGIDQASFEQQWFAFVQTKYNI